MTEKASFTIKGGKRRINGTKKRTTKAHTLSNAGKTYSSSSSSSSFTRKKVRSSKRKLKRGKVYGGDV